MPASQAFYEVFWPGNWIDKADTKVSQFPLLTLLKHI